MIDPKFFDEVAKKISNLIPDNFKTFSQDLEKNIKTILQNAFAKLDLVTRDEFDLQTKVLARSREKLEQLEQKVTELEKMVEKNKNGRK